MFIGLRGKREKWEFLSRKILKRHQRGFKSRARSLLVLSLFIPLLESGDEVDEVDSDVDTLRKYLLQKSVSQGDYIRAQSCGCGSGRSQQLPMEKMLRVGSALLLSMNNTCFFRVQY